MILKGTRTRHRARKGEGELLRTEILDAARGLLVGRGSSQPVSMRMIAKAVGVSPPSLYLHFPDKESLLYEVCRGEFIQLAQRMQEAVAGEEPVTERLRRAGRAYIEWGLEQGAYYRVLFVSGPPESIDEEALAADPGHQAFTGLVALIRLGIDREELRRDLDPVAAAFSAWSAVHGAVLLLAQEPVAHHIPGVDQEAVIEAVLQVVTDGLSAAQRAGDLS